MSIKLAALALLLSTSLADAQAPKVSTPWYPQGRLSSAVAVTDVSAATALPTGGSVAWLCNTGSTDAYVAFGGSTISTTATTGSWLKQGTCAAYDLAPFGSQLTYMAAITASSTTNIAVETGQGNPPVL